MHLRRRLARLDAPAALSTLSRGEFEGYASLFGVPDGAGDVMAPGAFAKSLRSRGLSRIRMLYQHFAHEPIGVWAEIREDARGLYVRGRLTTDIERGRDVLALLNDGALDGLSIGFKTKSARRDPATGARTLIEVELWEVSVVTFPLLEGSAVTAIGAKSVTAQHIRLAAEAVRPKIHLPLCGEVGKRSEPDGGRCKGTRSRPPDLLSLCSSKSTSPQQGR
ncbi:MAG: HK97 family phage prohead protease [Alphaproteobacteria bacterium]|nr:HK97 family phage prohead protease [Alphaproteobacteria bacterium]